MKRREFLTNAALAAAAIPLLALGGMADEPVDVCPENDVLDKLEAAWDEFLARNGERPDFIVVSEDIYEAYQDAIRGVTNIAPHWAFESVGLEYPVLKYRGARVYCGSEKGPSCIMMMSTLSFMTYRTLRERARRVAENIENNNLLLHRL